MDFVEILFVLFILFYIIYTFLFALKFNKTNIFYNTKQKRIHNIMIWLVPFLWIILLKVIAKPVPGSEEFKDKTESKNSTPYEDRNPIAGLHGKNF
jgi:heme/copper-type cytochrome/quinol oxidase subunit 2